MKTTIYHLTVITVLSLATVGCSVKEHAAPSGTNEPEVLQLPQGEEIQKRRQRFDAWLTAWKATVEDRLLAAAAVDQYTIIAVLDQMFDEIDAPVMPFYSEETHAALEREIEGGDELTPEEITRLEFEAKHAMDILGIPIDYAEEMFDHVRMTVKKLGIEFTSDAEDN